MSKVSCNVSRGASKTYLFAISNNSGSANAGAHVGEPKDYPVNLRVWFMFEVSQLQ